MLTLLHLISSKLGDKRTVIFAGVESLIIIILLAILIFRAPGPPIKTADTEKQWRDSIAVNNTKINLLQKDIERLSKSNDSLSQLKTNIQLVYDTKIKYITRAPIDTATAFLHRYLKGAN